MTTDIKIPAVFPFNLEKYEGRNLWLAYFQKNRDRINEQYGEWVFVGRKIGNKDGQEKSWTWYEVDVTVVNETTVEFQTYGMYCGTYGGRGDAQEKFIHTFKNEKALAEFVERRKREIAMYVHTRRVQAAEDARIEAERNEIYNELFPQAIDKSVVGV